MEDEKFADFLKKGGRKPSVIERVFRLVSDYERYLAEERDVQDISLATPDDLEAFVAFVEREPKASAKTNLWAIRYYYQYIQNKHMEDYTAMLREERIERTSFPIRDFYGVDQAEIDALAEAGIRNVQQMLEAGSTPAHRQKLADETGVSLEKIVELVRLSDLARIPGIKGIRARLYYEAGIDSIENLASWDADQLLETTARFVEESGFDGIAPLPKEVRSGIAKARRLPKVVEYDEQ